MAVKKKRSNPIITFIKATLIITIAVILAGYAAVKLYLNDLSPIPQIRNYHKNVITEIYSSDGQLLKTFQAFHYEQASIKDIPQDLKDAIVSTEDKNFYSHDGYDITGIIRSMVVNIMNKKASQGASTITQQLARMLFLSNEKTVTRKIKEIQIAARIEKTLSKDEILEMYLNNVYLGSGAYGVGAAASVYFNKNLSELTRSECALLAGLPQAPSVYSPYKNIKLAEKRRNKVLKRMYVMGKITQAEYENAKKEKIVLNKKPNPAKTNSAPYFIDYIMKELESIGFDETEISQGGYKIITTLDYKAQTAANEAINKNMNAYKLTGEKQQAALFSYSPTTGAIIAYCGGKDYSSSQYDRVIQAVRPPGSAFKPIVYAAAIHKGWLPNDTVEDSPVTIGDWTPRNYGDKYRGEMPLYKALAISSNVVAVKLLQDVEIPLVIEMAKALGITTPLKHDYTISLGSNGVKLFDMVVVYGNFANGGYRVEPYGIERIETHKGKVLYQAKRTKITRVIDRQIAGLMTTMLKQVILNGTGRAANINKPMAGKTGTTNENKDAWFIGYTPDIVTGVFIGNDNNKSIGLTGGTAPAKIWKDMMTVATEKYGSPEFDYPHVALVEYVPKPLEHTIKTNEEPLRIPVPQAPSDLESFNTIPVQLNENISNEIKAETNAD